LARNRFQVETREQSSKPVLLVSGVIDENADLSSLSRVRAPEVEINLKGVRRINSFGVRAWIDAVRQIPASTRVAFVHCPPPVIDQCNMVSGFLGHGVLESFYAPMTCEECDEQLDQLFETARARELGGNLPPTPCPRCGREMEVDDLEEQYLLFVREPERSAGP
jgi:hypothetical protein